MRAWIYDRAFKPLTVGWYASVLGQIQPGARLLDVGIGTAGALVANAKILRDRDIRVHGVDIDADYVARAKEAVADAGLSDRVTVALESIYDHAGGPYDAAYFGASFMLMPDPQRALRHVMGRLTPNGKIYFTQTFQERRSRFLEVLKPMLVRLTTIDFGTVTYEAKFLAVVEAAGMEVLSNDVLSRKRSQSFRRIVGRPKAAGGSP